MKKRLASTLFMSGVITAVVGLGATSALAANTWTVSNGGAWTANTGTGTTVFKDTTHPSGFGGSNTLTCSQSGSTDASTAAGNLPNGTGLSNPLGTITSLAFNNCTAPSASSVSVTNNSFPWDINGDSYSSGVTTGHISGVNSSVTITSFLGTCKFTVSGNATGTYTNSTGVLHLQQIGTTNTLSISNVNHSGGAVCNSITNGDTATFDTPPDTGTLGGYTVTNGSGGHPTITSP